MGTIVLVWIVSGTLVGLNYGRADAGTPRADAPSFALQIVLYLPWVAGPSTVLATRRGTHARLSATLAALAAVGWVARLVVVLSY